MVGPEDVEEEEGELIESPNMRDQDASPMCFLTADRPCGAECLAYVTHPKLAKASDLSEQQAHCAIINNLERVGRGTIMVGQAVAAVASSAHSLVSRGKTAEADKVRTSQFDPATQATTSPFGKKDQA